MVDEFSDIFGLPLCLLLKVSEVICAGCIFIITKGEDKLTYGRSLTYYLYIIIAKISTLIPHYFCGEIESTSESLNTRIYSSDWTSAPMPYKKSMLILMENLKKPITVTVPGYNKLNLEAFREVKLIKKYLISYDIKFFFIDSMQTHHGRYTQSFRTSRRSRNQ